jgi:hypothetical protein
VCCFFARFSFRTNFGKKRVGLHFGHFAQTYLVTVMPMRARRPNILTETREAVCSAIEMFGVDPKTIAA